MGSGEELGILSRLLNVLLNVLLKVNLRRHLVVSSTFFPSIPDPHSLVRHTHFSAALACCVGLSLQTALAKCTCPHALTSRALTRTSPVHVYGSFNTDIPHKLCPRDAPATFSSSASSGTPYSKTSSPCLSWHCPPCLRCSYPPTVTHQWTAASSSPAAHSSSAGGEHLRLAPWPPRLPWYQPTSCPPRQRSPVPTASGNKGLGFRVHGFRV